MNYYKSIFKLEPILPAREILVAELAERGYESFVETESGVEAFIQEAEFNESLTIDLMATSVADYYSVHHEFIKDENWNTEWEKNFDPIEVDGRIRIRAPFHSEDPILDFNILIEPKMSFGTGHHDTTYLVLAEMLKINVEGKRLLDMGSGTGILAILAYKLKASEIDAIDIDDWAFENIAENIDLNHAKINAFKGGSELLAERSSYDIILANINRNILTRDMGEYNEVLNVRGQILFSGFYNTDFEEVNTLAVSFGWQLQNRAVRNEWCMLRYEKS